MSASETETTTRAMRGTACKAPELQPTPWTVKREDWSDCLWIRDARDNTVVLVTGYTTERSEEKTADAVIVTTRKIPIPHAERTAQLLAAAPAMAEALQAFVKAYDDCVSNHDGEFPLDGPDCGCIECTQGTVPNDKNTGLCAYHQARAALSKAGA